MFNPPISAIFHSLQATGVIGSFSSEIINSFQQQHFFSLAANKEARTNRLRESFRGKGINRIFLSHNLRNFGCKLQGCATEYLSPDCLNASEGWDVVKAEADLRGALVVVNNNDAARNLAAYFELFCACPETIFAGWDWDNHHWMEVSSGLAAHSDIYAPAHHENLYQLTRYNWLTVGPIYCATVQWSAQFLADALPEMITCARMDVPLGKHIPYAMFEFRNQVLATLSQSYDSIGFSDRTFHARTPEDRFREWIAYKLHWISPVLNDVPIRIFDALITGGIPVVPESLRHLPPLAEIDDRHILAYSPSDILNPRPLVQRGVELFDSQGSKGIAERHHLAMSRHHGDQAISAIRRFAERIFCSPDVGP
jgi:hypothetical protein